MSANTAFGRASRRALLSASAAVLALALSHQAAQAQQAYDVTFNNSGTGASGSAIVTTSGAVGSNGYQVDFITGSLTAPPVYPGTYTITGLSNYGGSDNVIQTTSPYVDSSGISFTTNTGPIFNIYLNPLNSIELNADNAFWQLNMTVTEHPSVDTQQASYDENSTPLAQSTVVFEGGTFKPTGNYTLSAPMILSSLGGTIDASNGAVTLSGNIAGPGGLTTTSSQFTSTTGQGWVVLTGTNSYTGGTTVNQGSLLQLGTGGTTGSVTGDITNNGWLQFDRSDNTTFAGAISGTGNEEKFGNSTLTLTGANTNTGTFYVVEGALVVGDGGTSGSWAGNIAGPVTFNRSDTLTFGGVLSDINAGSIQRTSSLTQAGSGTLILTGDNSYTGGTTIHSGGTIQIGDGGTSGSIGSGDVTNDGHLVFDRSDTLVYGGAIAGSGDLTVGGTGTFVLTGVNTFSGTTTINAGATLQLGNDGGSVGLLAGAITDNGSLVFKGGAGSLALYATGITGTGDLTVADGTIELSGTNTYTGKTTIDAGATLQLVGTGSIAQSGDPLVNGTFDISGASGGVSVVSLSGSGSVVLGANTLTLTNASETFSGGISGAGGLTIAAGTETLSGVNTFSGTTTVSAGATLRLGDGAGNAGLLAGAITDNGSIVFDAGTGAFVLYATGITGSGDVTVASGTLALTGVNTYSGTTTIGSGATLQLGADGGSVGLLAGAITDNGSLVFKGGAGSLALYATGITGSGDLTVADGTIELTGTNTYTGKTTVDAGATLQLGSGGSTGSVAGDIVNNGSLVFDYSGNGPVYGGAISGSGGVTTAAGIVTLTGNSTYTGGTTIDNGSALVLGDGGTTGSVTGDIHSLGGTLAFYHSNTVTYGGVYSGSGNLLIEGTGTAILTGTNTSTGLTSILAGATLQLGNGGATGSVAGNIADNGALVFDHGANTSYGGAITGTGSVTVAPTGYGLYFTGANTYTGGTTVGAGTALFLGNGGTSGSITGNVVLNGGDLVFDRSDNVTFSGQISGSGGWITLLGGGTVTLTAANTFTGPANVLAGSTLQLGAGGTTGSIVGNVTDNGTLVFDRSDTVTFNGVISGSGKLTQAGSGVTILDGVNTVSGLTTVSAGVLEVGDAAHPGAVLDSHLGGVSVGAAGTLAGHGVVLGAVTNTSGGVVSPGGSIGTLTVGSYTQGANSTLAIEVSPTQASLLNVTGAASLNGKLSLAFDAGTYTPHIYEIVAAGSVSGTFSSVDMSGTQAGIVYGVAYKSDQVDLVMAPTRNALVYGDVSTATLDRAQSFASLVEDRFGDAVCANGAADKPRGEDNACHGMGAWAQAIASSDHAGAVGAGYGFNNRGAGFVGGIDHRWSRGATLGVAFGYQDNSLSISGASTSASGHAYFGSVYGRWSVGAVKLDGQAFYMNSDWSLNRSVPGYGKASSSPNGDTEGFLFQASAPIGQTGVSPYVRVAYAQFNRDGVSETGVGSLGYAVASASSSSTLGEIGFTYARIFGEAGGRQLVPSLRLGVQKDFSDRSQTLDASLTGVSGSAFSVSYDKPGQTAGVADLSLKAQLTPCFELTGELRGRFGDNVSEGTATVGGAYRF